MIVIVACLIYQQFENYVTSPRVFGRTLNISPFTSLISVLIGSKLLGIPGVLLGPSVAAMISAVIRVWADDIEVVTGPSGPKLTETWVDDDDEPEDVEALEELIEKFDQPEDDAEGPVDLIARQGCQPRDRCAMTPSWSASAAWAQPPAGSSRSRGKRVLGLEQFDIPHASGSSHGINRIIRLAYYEDPSYVPLLKRAYELWRELESACGEHLLHITGSIDASEPDGIVFSGALESCKLHDLSHEVLTSAELTRRYPGYRASRRLSRALPGRWRISALRAMHRAARGGSDETGRGNPRPRRSARLDRHARMAFRSARPAAPTRPKS